MNFFECLSVALNGLKSNKMRAFLTMLGIIIGISSVMLITTLGAIVEKKVSESYESLGTDLIMVYSDYREGVDYASHVIDDVSEVYFSAEAREQYIERYGYALNSAAVSQNGASGTIHFNDEDLSARTTGVSDDYLGVSQTKLVKGRYISADDIKYERNVCVLTKKQVDKLFPYQNPLGQSIEISTAEGEILDFTVIGVTEPSTSQLLSSMQSMIMGESDWDRGITIPLSVAERYDPYFKGYYSMLMVSGNGEMDVAELSEVTAEFFNETYFKNNDYFNAITYTAQEELEMINSVMGLVSVVISVIAGISLVVGGIGVMNIMLVSVTERTREIGVRKALGAPNSAIRMQFIIESIVICLIGGFIGILLGFLLGNIGGIIAGATVPPDPFMVFISVSFSMAIGVFFGFYPANKAAKMDPIDALRYE